MKVAALTSGSILNFSSLANDTGVEVDFIVGDHTAIEVKSTHQVTSKHLKNLRHLREENICQQYFLVSQDRLHRVEDGIEIIHWEAFLEKIHQNKLLHVNLAP